MQYAYEKQTQVRLTVGKGGMLQECPVHFEVVQEYSAGGRGERIVLGQIHLNLAEYVDAAEVQSPGAPDSEDGIMRRYLMQDSKINSTLKIGISMQHFEGTRDYYAPQLRTAPVFGGIAGIIAGSEPAGNPQNAAAHTNGDADGQDAAALPNFSTTNKELGEMQDMYRRTLAAYWASQPGELRADECIEDIFGGGDGWGKGGRPVAGGQSQPGSGSSTPNEPDISRDSSAASKLSSDTRRNFIRHHDRKGRPRRNAGELEELDVRDDLVSWQVGERAY